MPLPTTNLSLNAIHVEVGGTSGTQVSLNDADVRGIGTPDTAYAGADGINTTSGSQISIGEFRNASAGDQVSFTVDADESGYTYYQYYGGASGAVFFAYHGSPSFSASDTFDLISGSPQFFDITEYLDYDVSYGLFGSESVSYNYRYVQFALVGTHSNAGWTSMAIGNTTYNRTAADSFLTYTVNGTAVTAWRWNTSTTGTGAGPDANFPEADFSADGTTQTVYFT